MMKRGTYCYVVHTCRASPAASRAIGKIVEVVRGPYERTNGEAAYAAYDVHYRGLVYYCHAQMLRPINDPDADVDEFRDGTLAR